MTRLDDLPDEPGAPAPLERVPGEAPTPPALRAGDLGSFDRDREERRALAWCALAAVAIIMWIVLPIGVGIFLGVLMGFALQPLYELLRRRLRPTLAAVCAVLIATHGIAASVGGLGYLLATKGVRLTKQLLAALSPGGGASSFVEGITARSTALGFSPQDLEDKVREGAADVAASAAGIAEVVAAATASAALGLFFATLTMYYVLRNWSRLSERAQTLLPLRADYTRALFDEFRRVGRSTFLGTLVTGIAQGILATIGFTIARLPESIFFGAITAVASLIPAVGTLLVWVPAGIVLILSGHLARGTFLLVWGLCVVVGVSDYVIRPRLVGSESATPAIVTFSALFGGAEAFGLKGLILGPVLMSLAISVLRLYGHEMELRRKPA
jgi:predicted PurR-regulated permease PerM